MKTESFREHVQRVMDDIVKMERDKGHEYAGTYNGVIDRFSQFKNIGKYTEQTPERVLFGFVIKHWDALHEQIKKGPLEYTKITAYTRDIILYMLLLEGISLDNPE